MIAFLPKKIEFISMFINKKNKKCFELVNYFDFNKISEETIMIFERNYISKLDDIPIVELVIDEYEDMKLLHHRVFPDAYYTGEEIIGKLNSNRKVFIQKHSGGLAGYIYVEAEPKFGEGNIEFFAVNEAQRHKGVGSKLLTMALKWLFSFDSINSITLCVNSENMKAFRLYEKVGFKEKYSLYYFTKDISN